MNYIRKKASDYYTVFKRKGSDKYCFEYYDPITGKKRRKSTGYTSRRESEKLAKEFMDALTREESLEHKLVNDELMAWRSTMQKAGRARRHYLDSTRRVHRLLQAAGVTYFDKLATHPDWLGTAQSLGLSVAGVKSYIQSLKQFGNYLKQKGLLSPSAPLLLVRAPVPREADQAAHALLEDADVHALMSLPDEAGRRHALEAHERRMLYTLMATTGLRTNEAQSLTKRDFTENGIRIKAQNTKNKKASFIPLPNWLQAEMAPYLEELTRDDLLFPRKGKIRGGEMMREDLEYLGVDLEKYQGTVSTHGLRVWFTTKLAENPAVTFRTVMELARHSSPALTAKVYARAGERHKDAAIADTFADRPPRNLPPGTGKG